MDLTNQFLIAMPTLADPNFAKTVTYIYAHDEGGAFGIVINRPVDIRFSELLDPWGSLPTGGIRHTCGARWPG